MANLKALVRADYEFLKQRNANPEHSSKLSHLDDIILEAQLKGQDIITFDGVSPNPNPTRVHVQVVDFWEGAGSWTASGYDYVVTATVDPQDSNYRIITEIDMS